MATSEIFFFSLFSFFFFLLPHVAANITYCGEAHCGVADIYESPVTVHFPFRLRSLQRSRCGYRSEFDLSCNNRNKTILSFRSGEFVVRGIDYKQQSIWINDPGDCLPKRFLDREFEHDDSDFFKIDGIENYTFLNCSRDLTTSFQRTPISCLSSPNGDFFVFAVPTLFGPRRDQLLDSPSPSPSPPPLCSVIKTTMVPISPSPFPWPDTFSDLSGNIRLTWTDPNCGECEARGGDCGFQIGSKTKIGCSVSEIRSNRGLPRSAKYGIIIGVGIPGLLCIIGLASYICGKVKACGRRRRPYTDYTASEAPGPVVVLMGFDGPTIESFPKTQLGESKRLPKPNDNTCPICLSEYQPKETLRTIPECNHYFHASCVDEWLKMNVTCPLCRNSPEGSSGVSPSSSVFSSSSSLASS